MEFRNHRFFWGERLFVEVERAVEFDLDSREAVAVTVEAESVLAAIRSVYFDPKAL